MEKAQKEVKNFVQVNPKNLTIAEREKILEVFYSWFELKNNRLIKQVNEAEDDFDKFDHLTKKMDDLMYAELRKKGLYDMYLSLLMPES